MNHFRKNINKVASARIYNLQGINDEIVTSYVRLKSCISLRNEIYHVLYIQIDF